MRKFNTGDRVTVDEIGGATVFTVVRSEGVVGFSWFYDLKTDSGSVLYLVAEASLTRVSKVGHWDRRHMALAAHIAQWSKDPSTKVGAVAIGHDRRMLAIGYNGFPPGVADTSERLNDRDVKYAYTQHAERNVLDNALFDLRGGTLVTTMFPCVECAKSIVSKGIVRVVTPPPPEPIPMVKTWRDTVPISIAIFEEAKVKIVVIPDTPAPSPG